jgi:hypothetical protein
VKAKSLLYKVQSSSKYDGTNNTAYLHAVALEDGRYVGVDSPQSCFGKTSTEVNSKGEPQFDGQLTDTEVGEFETLTEQFHVERWLYSDNPAVYGWPDENFEVGPDNNQQVSCEEANGWCDSGEVFRVELG